MKGIYLASFIANHPGYNIVYQDINGKRDLAGDMLSIDLSPFDFIIATPPCNYWSKSNYRRDISSYSQNTKHLLPGILKKLVYQDKPFIVENVRNFNMFSKAGLFDLPCFVYFIGRHTYWTNVFLPGLKQDIKHITNLSRNQRQGGSGVYEVINYWLDIIYDKS